MVGLQHFASRAETFIRVLVAVALLVGAGWSAALADPTPTPSASAVQPAPVASTSSLGWQNSVDGFISLVDQATEGRGTQPPEGPGFAAGFVLSPMTPYDTFSSAPMTPGVAGIGQFTLLTSYTGKKIFASLQSGVSSVTGSTTNAAYWTENLLPVLNPHLGSQALPYSIAFPSHAGQDDATVLGLSIFSASIGSRDGSWNLRGGWFDLNQTDRFVFVQPALTNQTPEVSLATAESLGTGAPVLDGWPSPPPGLPLDGVDLTLHQGSVSAELTNAALPSLPGTSARISLGSVILDRGEGTQFSAEILHLVTGGEISTTTLFGSGARLFFGPQGALPFSNLGGQISTIAGVAGSFHVAHSLDATVEYGRTWYDADHVIEPGTAKPGNYYHAALSHPLGTASVGIDAYRFEPRYATAILPYGAPENVWSVAWSWPGVWLKSTYQLVDNTQIGANRQGYRVHYTRTGGSLDVHASFAQFQQIDAASIGLSHQTGFVEGFFLPQQAQFATLGKQKQYACWLAWHPKFGTVTLDFVDDMMQRDAAPSQPQDAVSYDAPQVVLALSKSFNKRVLSSIGFGRYAMLGSWAHGPLTNVNYQQDVVFAGGQYAESPHAIILIQIRHSAFSGLPSILNGPSPDFHGSLLILEQRFHY